MKTSAFLTVPLLVLALASPISRAEDHPTVHDVTGGVPAISSTLPPINHLVFLAKLPLPEDLMKAAAAQGITVVRIDQTGDCVIAVYQFKDGHTDSFGYRVSTATAPVGTVTVPTASTGVAPQYTVVAGPANPTVVYTQPSTVYYGGYPGYYGYGYPSYSWGAPVSIGIGFGWYGGGYGHYHGGYYGHGGYGHYGWHH